MCCFMVLAIYLLIHERLFVAALAIATAVMLKEIALAFWLVAVLYVLVRLGGPCGSGRRMADPGRLRVRGCCTRTRSAMCS